MKPTENGSIIVTPDISMNMPRESSGPKDFVLSLPEEVDRAAFLELINAYNRLELGDFLYIYIYSGGGDTGYAEAIIDLINANCDRTILIAHGDVFSAAFEIFFRSECERKVLPGTIGMAHFTRVGVTMLKENTPSDERGRFTVKWGGEEVKKSIKFYVDLGFTAAELKLLKENRDVFFNDSRLNTLLKNSIKNINARYK